MKKYIITLLMVGLFSMAAWSQQQQYVADSVMAARTLSELNQLFNLSPGQQDTLLQAGIAVGQARRQVLARYWKTDSFRLKMAEMAFLKDSLYRSALGPARFKVYRDTLTRRGRTW